jgi:hypothetical protein
LEEFEVAVFKHGRARSGWNDDIPGCLFKNPDGVLGQGAGLAAQPGVKGRLPAACLVGRKLNPHPGTIENMNQRFAYVREKRINQAGDKKLDGFSFCHLKLFQLVQIFQAGTGIE